MWLEVATLAAVFAVAAGAVLMSTPLVISAARRLRFYDCPEGYKAHAAPTPYLGGIAVMASILLAAGVTTAVSPAFAAVLAGAVLMMVTGTVDDRRNLRPATRLVLEAAVGLLLWFSGVGWELFANEWANAALSVVWVVGLVNAFNLMDNMDGATSAVAATSGAAIAAIAVSRGDMALAALAVAVSGACVAFLRFNLARPARIFLGDGGSMPLGFVLSAAVMMLTEGGQSGASRLVVGGLLVGLPIFDTALVLISRYRRGAGLWTGGRDHITHRLIPHLGSARVVAFTLAGVQGALCCAAWLAASLDDRETTIALVSACMLVSAFAMALLESTFDRSAPRNAVAVAGLRDAHGA